jgi:hypothetical protein
MAYPLLLLLLLLLRSPPIPLLPIPLLLPSSRSS